MIKNLPKFLNKVFEWGILILIFSLPLFFDLKTADSFFLPKILFFRFSVLSLFFIWLIKSLLENKIKDDLKNFFRSSLTIALCAFIFSVSVSALFSLNRYLSFWGSYLRYNGLLNIFFLFGFFFLASSAARKDGFLKKIFWVASFSAGLISLYAIFQHFGLDFIDWQTRHDIEARVISTIGNPLYLGGFLVMVMPLTLFLVFSEAKIQRKILFILIFICQVLTLVFTLSRSAWLAFILSFFVFIFLYGILEKKKIIWRTGLAVLIFFIGAGMLFVLFSPAGSYARRWQSIFDFSEPTVAPRLLVWQSALEGIADSPVIGSGPETFIYVFNQLYPPKLTAWSERWFDRAHNLFLDLGVTQGFLGLISFLAVIGVFYFLIARFIKKSSGFSRSAILALGVGTLAYLFQNQFSFNTPATAVYFYLFLGAVSGTAPEIVMSIQASNIKKWRKACFVAVAMVLFTALTWQLIFMPWRVDRFFARGEVDLSLYEKSPHQNYYKLRIAENYFKLALGEVEVPKKRIFLNEAENILKSIIAKDKFDLPAHLLLANLYRFWGKEAAESGSEAQEKFAKSEELFRASAALSPFRQTTYWEWAKLYLVKNETKLALEKYQIAINLAPEVGESYYELGRAYEFLGEKEKAEENFNKAKDFGFDK